MTRIFTSKEAESYFASFVRKLGFERWANSIIVSEAVDPLISGRWGYSGNPTFTYEIVEPDGSRGERFSVQAPTLAEASEVALAIGRGRPYVLSVGVEAPV